MLRTILGVIAGYIVMSLVLFVLFSVLYTVLGTSGSFQEGSYFVSNTWLFVGFLVFFVGAVAAGFVCALISKNANAGMWMGGVILVLGLIIAVLQIMQAPASTVREAGEVALMDAMNLAQQPVWTLFVNPVVGFIGAIVGGRLRGGGD